MLNERWRHEYLSHKGPSSSRSGIESPVSFITTIANTVRYQDYGRSLQQILESHNGALHGALASDIY